MMERKDLGTAQSTGPTLFKVGISRATIQARWLGGQLRQHRETAGLKASQAAHRLRRSPATVSRWESGAVVPRPGDVHYLLELYGVRGEQRDELMRDVEEIYEEEEGPDGLNDEVARAHANRLWLEIRAWNIQTFQQSAIPGLLQTADYARGILAAWNPATAPARIERAITARATRQRRLTDDEPLRLSVILDEAALHRPIGGSDTMRTQLEYLIERAKLQNVEIRILPFAAGPHASLSSSFEVIQVRDEPDLIYLETRAGHMYLDHGEPFAHAWSRLDAVALSQEESIAMIAALQETQ